MKPTALGQGYTTYSCILCLGILEIHLIQFLKQQNGVITKKNLIIIITSLVLWSYLVLQALFVGSNGIDNVIKAGGYHTLIILTFAIVLSQSKDNYLYFRWLIKVLFAFSLSYIVTVSLGTILGGIEKLHLFDFQIKTYDHPALMYFPFTSISSFMVVGGLKLPRLLGMFREPGIFQAFLIWAYFNLKQYDLDSKITKFTLVVGIIGTFSTAGIAIFIGTIAIRLFLNKKILKSIVIVVLSIVVLNYAPFIGLKSKSITAAASLDDRSYATKIGLEKLLVNPIGTGMYNHDYFDVQNAGINLLSSSYMIGIVGVLLVLLVYFLPLYKYPYKSPYLVGVAPLLITLLYAQPILDAPLVYIMLLANYGMKEKQENAIRTVRNKNRRRFKLKKYKLTW